MCFFLFPFQLLVPRAFSNTRKSKVSNNYLRNFNSINALNVIGLAFQGDAKGFKVYGNTDNLNPFSKSTVYTSLYIGMNVDEQGTGKTIVLGTNYFSHQVVVKNTIKKPPSIRHRSLQASSGGGGCPYSNI